MRPAQRALSVVALIFFVWTGTASAECAWVLWTEVYTMSGGNAIASLQQPADAFKTKEECERFLTFREKREDGRRKTDPSKERYFSCLPDTVDPRGPKTK